MSLVKFIEQEQPFLRGAARRAAQDEIIAAFTAARTIEAYDAAIAVLETYRVRIGAESFYGLEEIAERELERVLDLEAFALRGL